MTRELETKIRGLLEQAIEAKREFSMERLSIHLDRYRAFVLGMRSSIADIRDYESFRAFRTKWKESGGIAMLPKELTAFNRYMSLANTYNAELIPQLLNSGKVLELVPIMFSQDELDIIKNAAEVYKRPFVWDKIKDCLVGEAARTAVYTHAAACLAPEDFCQLIDGGSIRMETLEHLPYVVSLRDINGDGENDKQLQQAYQKNLAAIYDHYGKELPEATREEVLVCGVSFENRSQKLTYLLRWAREYTKAEGAEVFRDDGSTDINRELVIELGKYLSHTGEPAIQVLVTIPGDPKFCRMNIGHIPREIAIRIDEETPHATLAAELNEIGIAPIPGRDGTVEQPYVKLLLIIGDKPYEIERPPENQGAEVDGLFNEELR